LNRYKSSLFSVDKEFKLLSAEASDLGGLFMRNQEVVVYGKNGIGYIFNLAETNRDLDGDICYWMFRAASFESKIQGWQVLIYND
jgi:hypothetical protein